MQKLVFITLAVLAVAIVNVHGQSSAVSCENNDACTKIDANSKCIELYEPCDKKYCWCKKGYIGSGDKCKKLKSIGDSCDTSTEVCDGGSSCSSDKKCTCPSSTTEQSGKCMSDRKKLGESCTSNSDCRAGECTDSKCKCPSGYEEKDGNCADKSILEKMTLKKGETCGKSDAFCKEGLQCGVCPGTTAQICLKFNGAETLAPLSLITLVVSLLAGKFFF